MRISVISRKACRGLRNVCVITRGESRPGQGSGQCPWASGQHPREDRSSTGGSGRSLERHDIDVCSLERNALRSSVAAGIVLPWVRLLSGVMRTPLLLLLFSAYAVDADSRGLGTPRATVAEASGLVCSDLEHSKGST